MEGRERLDEIEFGQMREQDGDEFSLELFRCRQLQYILVKC
jgi:hypothetical protein